MNKSTPATNFDNVSFHIFCEAITIACGKLQYQIFSALIEKCPHVFENMETVKMTLFELCKASTSEQSSTNVANLLIQKIPTAMLTEELLSSIDDDQHTCIMRGCASGNIEAVCLLIDEVCKNTVWCNICPF